MKLRKRWLQQQVSINLALMSHLDRTTCTLHVP